MKRRTAHPWQVSSQVEMPTTPEPSTTTTTEPTTTVTEAPITTEEATTVPPTEPPITTEKPTTTTIATTTKEPAVCKNWPETQEKADKRLAALFKDIYRMTRAFCYTYEQAADCKYSETVVEIRGCLAKYGEDLKDEYEKLPLLDDEKPVQVPPSSDG